MDDERTFKIRARAEAMYISNPDEDATDLLDLLDEVERLREVAGLAEGRRECAQANHDRIAQMIANQNAGLVVMARERDEARAEVERLRRVIDGLLASASRE